MATETYNCPTCHHTSNIFKHRLSAGIVGGLIKLKRAVIETNQNDIHLIEDMKGRNELTRNEWTNFSKLRFHALVAHVTDEEGKRVQGRWLLTKRGNQFLRGEIDVPQYVRTMNNHVIHDEHDAEIPYVMIEQIMGTTPVFDDINTIEKERQPLEGVPTQSSMFDTSALQTEAPRDPRSYH